MKEPILLKTVHYDPMARGPWCRSPYHNHPNGCPNFPKCIQAREDFRELAKRYPVWYAVVETFDLKAHALDMMAKHPERIGKKGQILPAWTEQQGRTPIYWQGGVRKRLREKARALHGNVILDIPEAHGIDVFSTMAEVGIILERTPNIVRKVMLVGRMHEIAGRIREDMAISPPGHFTTDKPYYLHFRGCENTGC